MPDSPASIPADHLSLVEAPGVVTFTTVGSNGYPQSSAIWWLYEDGLIRTSLHPSRQKYKNLLEHPKATYFWINPENTFQTLEVRGDIAIEPDHELVFLKRMLAHYGTTLEDFPAPVNGRVVVTLTPKRVRTNR